DPRLPAVRDHQDAVEFGQVSDPPDLGEPAAAVNVRLDDPDLAPLDPLAGLEAGGRELGPPDPDAGPPRQPRVADQVVVVQRGFGEIEVAVGDAVEDPLGRVPVAPAVAEVHHQGDLVAQLPAP